MIALKSLPPAFSLITGFAVLALIFVTMFIPVISSSLIPAQSHVNDYPIISDGSGFPAEAFATELSGSSLDARLPVIAAASGIQPGAGTGVTRAALLDRTRNLFTPFVIALFIAAIVAALSAILILFIRQRYPDRQNRVSSGSPGSFTFPIAGAFVVLGLFLAILALLILTSFLNFPDGTALDGGKVLCILCFYLAVSLLFLAYDLVHKTVSATLGSIHIALSGAGILGFALLMIVFPERRGTAFILSIITLACSAALIFWQSYRRNAIPQIAPLGEPPRADRTIPVTSSGATVPVDTSSSTATLDLQPRNSTPLGFPHELQQKYHDITLIGTGGFSMVFSAFRDNDGQEVAIKIPVNASESTGKTFMNEMRVWEMLRHPNIVAISAVNILPVPYVEMEYIPSTLEAMKKPLAPAQALEIVRQLADALAYAHGKGIIHRDIKPHNILMTTDGVPRITDWGLSKDVGKATRKSTMAGYSLDYAAPEQISPKEFGKTDQRTDIFQIGVVFYELLTGKLPFAGGSFAEITNAILNTTPVVPSMFCPSSEPLDAVVLKCLEKDSAKRYASARDLLQALWAVDLDIPVLEYAEISIPILIGNIIAARGYSGMAEVTTDIPGDLVVEGDPLKIEESLDALLAQAFRNAIPPKKIQITSPPPDDSSSLVIAIRDNGPGLRDAEIDLLFQPSPPSGTEKERLSLYRAKKYVRGHGGYISVYSVVNAGTTFTVHLPKKRQDAVDS